MSKPHFFLNCTHSKRRWKNNQFGGKWLFFCKIMNGQPCDESICKLLNRKKIKEVTKPQKSGIVVIDEGFLQKITSGSGSYVSEVPILTSNSDLYVDTIPMMINKRM